MKRLLLMLMPLIVVVVSIWYVAVARHDALWDVIPDETTLDAQEYGLDYPMMLRQACKGDCRAIEELVRVGLRFDAASRTGHGMALHTVREIADEKEWQQCVNSLPPELLKEYELCMKSGQAYGVLDRLFRQLRAEKELGRL